MVGGVSRLIRPHSSVFLQQLREEAIINLLPIIVSIKRSKLFRHAKLWFNRLSEVHRIYTVLAI